MITADLLSKLFIWVGIAALFFALGYMMLMSFVLGQEMGMLFLNGTKPEPKDEYDGLIDAEDPFSYCLRQNEFPYNMLCEQQAEHDLIDDMLNMTK